MKEVDTLEITLDVGLLYTSEGPKQYKYLSIFWDWLRKVLIVQISSKYLTTTRRQFQIMGMLHSFSVANETCGELHT
jgi:hypothetical protein